MAAVWRLVVLVTGIVCADLSAAGELDLIKEQLSEVEASQEQMRSMLQDLEQIQAAEIHNATQHCLSLKEIVDEQKDFVQAVEDASSGPCHPDNYTEIDDPRRMAQGVYSGYEDMCDKEIAPGWYRFRLFKRNAVIPTTCVPEDNCQTDAPTWVDLQGQSMPPIGRQIEARACSNWDSDCCNWEAPISVRSCGDFYVYKIQPLPTCDLSFCAELQN